MAQNNDMHRIAREVSRVASSSSEYTANANAPNYPQQIAALTLIRREVRILIAAVAANGTGAVVANANPTAFYCYANGRVLSARFIPSSAAVENGTNNANMIAQKLNSTGLTTTTVAQANTNLVAGGGTGTLAPGASVNLPVVSLAASRFTKGQVLSGTVTQNSAGVAMGAGVIQYLIELEGPADDFGLT